jgi:hypothetical protein
MIQNRIVKSARELIGTPYHHQGRVWGANGGTDCLGLIVYVCQSLGIPYTDRQGYSRHCSGINLIEEFAKQCPQSEERGIGKILIFSMRRYPCHCAIESEIRGIPTIIHAYNSLESNPRDGKSSPNCVTEHLMGEWWENKIVGIFDFPERL